jgi:hypothetical protein
MNSGLGQITGRARLDLLHDRRPPTVESGRPLEGVSKLEHAPLVLMSSDDL